MDQRPWMEFVETTVFTNRIEEFGGARILENIQSDLIADPELGPIIPGTHGARKGRVADPSSGRGKSSGYRYLYLYLKSHGRIYLLFIFAKNEQSNLTDQQKKTMASLIRQIEEEVQKRGIRADQKKKRIPGEQKGR
jgi:hypothetical protein